MGEDEFETDFEDDEGDGEGDVSFDVDTPSEVDDDGGEDGEGDEHIVHGLGARSGEDFGAVASAAAVEVGSKDEFGEDGADEDDDGGGGVFGCLGFGGSELFDSFDDDVDAGSEDDKSDENCTEALDFGAVLFELFMTGEFFTDEDDEAGDGVDEGVSSVRSDGERASDEADDEIKGGEEEVGGNKKVAGFDDDLATFF